MADEKLNKKITVRLTDNQHQTIKTFNEVHELKMSLSETLRFIVEVLRRRLDEMRCETLPGTATSHRKTKTEETQFV